MRVACVGAGPGGLYLSILLKRWVPGCDVAVHERNAPGHAEGWGIVYWDDLLGQLRGADPPSAARIREASAPWAGQAAIRDGRPPQRRDGGGYGLARRRLLEILGERAAQVGVRLRYGTEVDDASALSDADLIVACDGVGSRLRTAHADVFRPHVGTGRNKYIWLGVERTFEPFTFAFRGTAGGPVWFHAYAYGDTSTCIVECAERTWAELGFDRMTPQASATVLSRIFADELDGRPLMAGSSSWQSFRTVRNETWISGRTVLLGDAAHTAHFSIGSGTKLALEDAIALASALRDEPDVDAALRRYERERRPAVARAQASAAASAAWFENIGRYADLDDEAFFAVLLERRSRLLPHVTPRMFWLIHRASQRFRAIGLLRRAAARLIDGVRRSRAAVAELRALRSGSRQSP